MDGCLCIKNIVIEKKRISLCLKLQGNWHVLHNHITSDTNQVSQRLPQYNLREHLTPPPLSILPFYSRTTADHTTHLTHRRIQILPSMARNTKHSILMMYVYSIARVSPLPGPVTESHPPVSGKSWIRHCK